MTIVPNVEALLSLTKPMGAVANGAGTGGLCPCARQPDPEHLQVTAIRRLVAAPRGGYTGQRPSLLYGNGGYYVEDNTAAWPLIIGVFDSG